MPAPTEKQVEAFRNFQTTIRRGYYYLDAKWDACAMIDFFKHVSARMPENQKRGVTIK